MAESYIDYLRRIGEENGYGFDEQAMRALLIEQGHDPDGPAFPQKEEENSAHQKGTDGAASRS